MDTNNRPKPLYDYSVEVTVGRGKSIRRVKAKNPLEAATKAGVKIRRGSGVPGRPTKEDWEKDIS